MRIKVNKDFLTEYKNEAWKGFDLPEILSIIVGLLCAGGVILFVYFNFHISPASAVYFGVPSMIPALFIGFYKYQSYLSVPKWIYEMYYTSQCKQIIFKAGEQKNPNGHFFCIHRYNDRRKKKCA